MVLLPSDMPYGWSLNSRENTTNPATGGKGAGTILLQQSGYLPTGAIIGTETMVHPTEEVARAEFRKIKETVGGQYSIGNPRIGEESIAYNGYAISLQTGAFPSSNAPGDQIYFRLANVMVHIGSLGVSDPETYARIVERKIA